MNYNHEPSQKRMNAPSKPSSSSFFWDFRLPDFPIPSCASKYAIYESSFSSCTSFSKGAEASLTRFSGTAVFAGFFEAVWSALFLGNGARVDTFELVWRGGIGVVDWCNPWSWAASFWRIFFRWGDSVCSVSAARFLGFCEKCSAFFNFWAVRLCLRASLREPGRWCRDLWGWSFAEWFSGHDRVPVTSYILVVESSICCCKFCGSRVVEVFFLTAIESRLAMDWNRRWLELGKV